MKRAWLWGFSMLLPIALASAPRAAWGQSFSPGPATFLGGNAWERAQSVHIDAAGFVYICGSTQSANFPATPGAFDTTHGGGGNDGYVAKFSADGRQLIWCTFLGGSLRDDAYGVRADASGNVYVTGWTASADFPTTAGAYDRTHAGNGKMDIFIAKLSPNGSSLVYSTFVGGVGTDQCRGAMFVTAAGEVWFAGYSDSTDYPITSGAIQSTYAGGTGDAVAGKLSANGSSLLYSTYLGTSGPDNAFAGIHVHSDGSVLFGGLAGGPNLPTTAGAYQRVFGGGSGAGPWNGDVFAARFSVTSTNNLTVHYITYIGGSGDDMPQGQNAFSADANGNAVVLSSSTSPNYPVTAGAYQAARIGAQNLALSRLSLDGSTLLASTYIGGSAEPSGLRADGAGNVYLSGTYYPAYTGSHPTTAGAFQTSAGPGGVGFFTVMPPNLGSLIYSSYLGGSGDERIRCLCLTPSGGAVVCGDTGSTNFPLSPGAYQTAFAGGTDDAYFFTFAPSTGSPGSLQFGAAAYAVNEGAGSVTIAATRSGGSSGAVSVNYATAIGTAGASDFTAASGTLNWADGDASNKTFTVSIANDTAVESSETFTVSLSGPGGGATLGSPSSATVTIADNDVANTAPSVSAGPDQSVTLPASASLDGTVSDDGLPSPPGAVTTTWSKVSGPGTVTFGNANAIDTTAAFSAAGTYVLRLTANDSALSSSDDVSVTVNPQPPGVTEPRAHWKLDEISGIAASDASGNGNHGTLSNGPVWAAGKLAGALRFDGVNDTVGVPDAASLSPAASALSLAAWVSPENIAAGGMILSKGVNGGQYHLRVFAGSLRFTLTAGGVLTAHERSFAFANNAWHHLAGVYDGANMRVFVNGVEIGAPTAKAGAVGGTDGTGVSLGNRSGSTINYFKGSIDDARIYGRALSAAEVAALANPAPPPNQPPTTNAGPDQALEPGTVMLSGSGADPDNGPSALTYAWTQVSGPAATINNANQASASASLTVLGAYVFRLTVSDGAASASDTVTINVMDSTPPSVDVTAVTLRGTVDGTGSAVVSVTVNGQAAAIAGNTWTRDVTVSAGTNLFTIVATDAGGQQTTKSVQITK